MSSHSNILRGCALLTGSLVVSPLFGAEATPKFESTELFPSWAQALKLSNTYTSISGSETAYQARTGKSKLGSSGIEDLSYGRDLAKDVSMSFDGHAMWGDGDYLGHLKLVKNEVGTLDFGYKSFTSFYDGLGGFFPLNNAFNPLQDRDLRLVRGKLWVEGTFGMPDMPKVTVRFVNETRDGQKDTSILGDSNLTGLPTTPANNATRKFIAGYLDIDETHRQLDFRVSHTFGKTSANLGVIFDHIDNSDTRFMRRFTNEGAATDRVLAQNESYDTDTVTVNGGTDTSFGSKFSISTNFSYSHSKSDIGGYRQDAVGYLPTFPFVDLNAKSKTNIYLGRIALKLKPFSDFFVEAALRAEDRYTKTDGTYRRITGSSAAALNQSKYGENSKLVETSYTPSLEVRYTGIKKVLLYANGSYRYLDGDEQVVSPFASAVAGVASTDDIQEDQGRYSVGANWLPCAFFTVRSEAFIKNHENHFMGYGNSLGTSYVTGYKLKGAKLTLNIKPHETLSLVLRGETQNGDMEVTRNTLATYDSMDARNRIFGASLTWSPIKQVYLQANGSLVYSYTSTAYPRAGGAANTRLRNADNNYTTQSLVAGFAVAESTDVELEYSNYHCNNFHAEIASTAMPYGTSAREDAVTVGVKHKLTDRLRVNAKIGYINSRDDSLGGQANFKAKLGYVFLEYAL